MANAFGLEDADFWTDPLRRSPRKGPPEEIPFGVVIGTPELVPLDARETLPLVIKRTSTMRDYVAADFKRLGAVVAVDVDRNELFGGRALETDNAVWSNPTAQELDKAVGNITQPYVSELRKRLHVPWRPADLVVTAFVRDVVSNRVNVRLGHAATRYEDPAVQAALEARRGELGPPPPYPSPGDPLPSYAAQPGSPPVPGERGIALSVDRVTVLQPRARVMVRGAFRLGARKQDLLLFTPGSVDAERRPTAIVAIHLVLMGSDDGALIVVPVRAPSWDRVDPAATMNEVTGHFAFDLLPLARVGPGAQTYFICAFSREVMAGPVPWATVTENMLPPGAR